MKLFDIDGEKINLLSQGKSPIKDDKIQDYLTNQKQNQAVSDLSFLFQDTDLYILCLPTNYDPEKNYFNTSVLESTIKKILEEQKDAIILIKSTVPVGFTEDMQEKFKTKNIIFSPEFLRGQRPIG